MVAVYTQLYNPWGREKRSRTGAVVSSPVVALVNTRLSSTTSTPSSWSGYWMVTPVLVCNTPVGCSHECRHATQRAAKMSLFGFICYSVTSYELRFTSYFLFFSQGQRPCGIQRGATPYVQAGTVCKRHFAFSKANALRAGMGENPPPLICVHLRYLRETAQNATFSSMPKYGLTLRRMVKPFCS